MIKQVTKAFVACLAVLLLMNGAVLHGQQETTSIQELRESALSHYKQGNFRAALSGFKDLMNSQRADPQYSYYAGRCLVELNEDLDEAIELLYGASKSNAFPDAIFYLGRAYHLSYNFQDARKCYEKYEMTASRQDRKKHQVKQLIGTCRTAREITSSYNPFEVMNVTFMDLSDSSQYTQVNMKGGELNLKPEAYFAVDEDQKALTGLMFMPKDPVRGDYAYYSGYARGRKGGAQIFRIRKGAGKSWGDPEQVTALNSSGDEILPYFDPIENDLYFASNGRFGVGGFDLFRAHYDMERDQWTDPVNLGFPVNSVMDEYLLLPGSDLGMVLFFSTRQATDSTVAVYRVHLVEPKIEIAMNDHKRLREIAQLDGAAELMLAGLGESRQSGQLGKQKSLPQTTPTAEKPAEEPEKEAASIYQETLASALRHQAVSDSLKDLAANARIRINKSDDPNDRWVWQKQIMVWEKNARDEEAEADLLYAKMEMERTSRSSKSALNPPESIEVDRVIDDLTVYRFAEPGKQEKKESAVQLVSDTPAPVISRINRFDILSRSPYDENSPIPMDIPIPKGTFYRIQMGAFGAEVGPEAFNGITPITGEFLTERGLVKYYAGKFSRYEDASTAIPRVHSQGYEDAFIVAWYNGIPVSTQKAKQLE